MTRAIFTIVSNNYLHYARSLFQSVARFHPECERICIVVDRDNAPARRFADEFAALSIDQLGLPDVERFAFRYSILELNTAVKPWAFEHVMARGHDEVVYLDPDTLLFSRLDEVFDLIDSAADIVLTPHLLAPMVDDRTPSELDIRRAGTYNLGFCAVADRREARKFLRWWQTKLVEHCVVDFDAGIFVDQSWIDLVPGLFGHVAVLRHPGYNVAYWNLAQRAVVNGPTGWTVENKPLVFFHFSGFDPENPAPVSKHQDRFELATVGAAKALFIDYATQIRGNDAAMLAGLPYGFGRFDNGRTTIPDAFRQLYRKDRALQDAMGARPFSRPEVMTTIVAAREHKDGAITYAMKAIRDAHASIRTAFPVLDEAAIPRFHAWFIAQAGTFYSEDVIEAHADLLPALGDSTSSPVPRGWSADERGVAQNGIWVAPLATLACAAYDGTMLSVDGDYPAGLIERQNGSRACDLSVYQGDRLLGSRTLENEGSFSFGLPWPDPSDRPIELRFVCSSHFVPAMIGLGPDSRRLSWKARRIAVDDHVLLDHGASPPITEFTLAGEGVTLVGYVAAESGVGESLRACARACEAASFPFSLHDVGYQNANRQDDRTLSARIEDRRHFPVTLLHVNADQTPRTLALLAGTHPKRGKTIAYWHWEQAELPLSFLPSFEGLAEVWVPSDFVRDAVVAIAPIPVFKVPHAIEFAIPAGNGRARFGLPSNGFLVLTMYDFDSHAARKNPQAAIAAFQLAFGSRDDVALVIKTINADRNPEAREGLRTALGHSTNIRWIDGYLTRDEIYALEHACDCFVSLHRSEGFGLGLAEMMYLGKPVIGTGWSGNMEFMTPTNSFPIGYRLEPLNVPCGPYVAGQPWAEADVAEAADVLLRLVNEPSLAREVGARAAAHMRRLHAPASIGERIRRRLALVNRRPH